MDRFSALEIFVKVIEAGSFTDAASALGVSKSHASKQIRRLEDRLGARLINRTTRQVHPTDAGRAFYERCLRVLEDLQEAEQAVGQLQHLPTGTLRLSVPVSFGQRFLGPAMAEFMARYPDLQVELNASDRRVDIVEEGYDLAIRIGALSDSSLIARRLAPVRMCLCASPSYFAEHGRPTHPRDLKARPCLLYRLSSTGSTWIFNGVAGQESVRVDGPIIADNGDILCNVAETGLGVAYMPDFLIAEAVQAGRLEVVLPEWWSGTWGGVWALYPHSRHLSAKVRLFIDFLVGRFSPRPPWHCPELLAGLPEADIPDEPPLDNLLFEAEE